MGTGQGAGLGHGLTGNGMIRHQNRNREKFTFGLSTRKILVNADLFKIEQRRKRPPTEAAALCLDLFSVWLEKIFGGCFDGLEVIHEDSDPHRQEVTQMHGNRGQHYGEHADRQALFARQKIGYSGGYEHRWY
jgi:hypothetical protein